VLQTTTQKDSAGAILRGRLGSFGQTETQSYGWSILILALSALTLWPFILQLIWAILHIFSEDVVPTGDSALLEFQVIGAMKFEQMLGPYSRYGWNHPGPMYLYFLMPIYWLAGQTWGAFLLGARFIALISAAVFMLLASFVYRDQDRALGYSLLILAACFSWINQQTLSSEWNPSIVLLPYLVLILSCAIIAAGDLTALPIGIVAMSFVVQTWIGLAPVAILVLMASLVIWFFPEMSIRLGLDTERTGQPSRIFFIVGIMIIILWCLPVTEQITHRNGNFSKIYQFIMQDGEGHHFLEAAIITLKTASWISVLRPESIQDHSNNGIGLGLAFVQLFMFAAAFVGSVKRKANLRLSLCITAAISLLGAMVTVKNIHGPFFFPESEDVHVVYWIQMVGFVIWAVVAAEMMDRIGQLFLRPHSMWQNCIAGLIGVVLLAGIGWSAFVLAWDVRQTTNELCRSGWTRRIFDPYGIYNLEAPLVSFLKAKSINKVVIAPLRATWAAAAGLAVRLHKNGIQVSVSDDWLFMYGEDFVQSGNEEAVIRVSDRAFQSPDKGILVAHFDPSGKESVPHDVGKVWIYVVPRKTE
jgi:hypothetical protein